MYDNKSHNCWDGNMLIIANLGVINGFKVNAPLSSVKVASYPSFLAMSD